MGNLLKIVTFVPHDQADIVRQAIGAAGGGRIGEYHSCSFSSEGEGRFVPTHQANPHIGTQGELTVVSEVKIEFVCERTQARQIIAAVKTVHPYEEVALDIFPLLTEDEL